MVSRLPFIDTRLSFQSALHGAREIVANWYVCAVAAEQCRAALRSSVCDRCDCLVCADWPLACGSASATRLPLRGDEVASAAACCSTSKSPVPCERDVDGMQSNARPERCSSCRRFDSSTSSSLDGARVNARIIDLGLGPQGTTRVRLWCWCGVICPLGSRLSEGHAEATRAGSQGCG